MPDGIQCELSHYNESRLHSSNVLHSASGGVLWVRYQFLRWP
jgi:hypothetical protein